MYRQHIRGQLGLLGRDDLERAIEERQGHIMAFADFFRGEGVSLRRYWPRGLFEQPENELAEARLRNYKANCGFGVSRSERDERDVARAIAAGALPSPTEFTTVGSGASEFRAPGLCDGAANRTMSFVAAIRKSGSAMR